MALYGTCISSNPFFRTWQAAPAKATKRIPCSLSLSLPSPMTSAPLFGLRWVPDAQLRPLRYLPSPANLAEHLSPRSAKADSAQTPAPRDPHGEAATPMNARLRDLTARLEQVQDVVRQKSEQIRWLKGVLLGLWLSRLLSQKVAPPPPFVSKSGVSSTFCLKTWRLLHRLS